MQDDIVVIVNGMPRSGKDTFCKYIEEYCETHDKVCYTWSTIDLEKEILEEYIKTYDPDGEWSSTDRAFLSEFKQLLNKYYDFTFDNFVSLVECIGGVILVHTREFEEIDRFKEYCYNNNVKFISVFITNPHEKKYYNFSDANCNDHIELYDYNINNDKGLKELEEIAHDFCNKELL